nr:MAG TPA: hypothetical protein [Caudoviricetes sp.]
MFAFVMAPDVDPLASRVSISLREKRFLRRLKIPIFLFPLS